MSLPCTRLPEILRLDAGTHPPGGLERTLLASQGWYARLDIDEPSLDEALASCEAVLVVSAKLPAEAIVRMRRCRIIARFGIGVDRIDVDAATRSGIVVANVPHFCDAEMGDHALAMILSLARRLRPMQESFLAGQWRRAREIASQQRRIAGQSLGLVGFGNSAKALAIRAHACGFRLLATRRRAIADPLASELGVEMVDLSTLLRRSDYVSLHLPAAPATRHLIGAEAIAMMKPGACLINTARGALVDEQALAQALRSGHLGGAALDTFDLVDPFTAPELPPRHPLIGLPNVVLTPHVAAYSQEATRDCVTGGIDNVVSVLSGRWPHPDHLVNPEVRPLQALLPHVPGTAGAATESPACV